MPSMRVYVFRLLIICCKQGTVFKGAVPMAATNNSGLGSGTNGSPQASLEEGIYAAQEAANEVSGPPLPLYRPFEKHDTTHNWGSPNHIKTQVEGQRLLDTGYHSGKQIYNITADRKIVKFQPDNTADNGYHAYEVTSPRDIPSSVLKKMRDDKVISNSEYTKFRKGKV